MDEWEAVNGGTISEYEEEDVEESVLESLVSDDSEILPFQAFCEIHGVSTPDSGTYREFQDSYAGEWDSFRAFSDDLADEVVLSDVSPDSQLSVYFDYEAFARDLLFDYTLADAPNYNKYIYRDL